MDENTRDELALFKFSIIAPIINGTARCSLKDYIEDVSAKKHNVPGYGLREFSPSAILDWLRDYRKYGFEGLKRRIRKDKGSSRKLSDATITAIRGMKERSPMKTATAIYCELLSHRLLGDPPASLSTVQRLIKKLDIKQEESQVERKRFEVEFANMCWQADSCVGPYLYIGGKKRKTYLLALLDDASRLVPHAEFLFEENVVGLRIVLKKAILKRGIPAKLFTDNAKIYSSLQLRVACATLGITLSHSRPYSPASKGKVERFFRTLRDQFFPSLTEDDLSSLEALNYALWAYLDVYNKRPHSSLNGLSPLERYLVDQDKFRFVSSKEYLDRVFLYEVTRTVTKDATISLMKRVFEVPQGLIGSSCIVRFDPEDLSCAFIVTGPDKTLVPVYPLRSIDNSKLPRKQNRREPIDYTKLYQGGDHE